MNTVLARALKLLRRDAERWRLAAAALLLLGCLLQPRWPMQRALFDHVVVLDVTQSMNVTDQQLDGKPVARLAFAKHLLRGALLELPCGSKIGWGLFTEYRSFLLFAPVEVCENLGELRSTLAQIDGRMAWTGNSEVAKGVFSGIAIAAALPEQPSLVFVTDGQEAPPVNPRHRPAFPGKAGEVQGLLVGVGELTPSPIPKIDPTGRPLGFWRADEVMQTDPRSRGRGGSVSGEGMVEDPASAGTAALPGVVPGNEHLSALREAYLRLLAGETGLGFHRLQGAAAFHAALTAPVLAKRLDSSVDLRPGLAVVALLLLLFDPVRGGLRWVFALAGRRERRSVPVRGSPPGSAPAGGSLSFGPANESRSPAGRNPAGCCGQQPAAYGQGKEPAKNQSSHSNSANAAVTLRR